MNAGEYEIRDDVHYTKEHEWLRKTQGGWEMGVTAYASSEMGDVAFVALPPVGKAVPAGDILVEIESVKAVSGNPASPVRLHRLGGPGWLEDEPERLNEAPYDTWIVRFAGEPDPSILMDADGYAAYLGTLAD
jgi:glycine cleavage system H protein